MGGKSGPALALALDTGEQERKLTRRRSIHWRRHRKVNSISDSGIPCRAHIVLSLKSWCAARPTANIFSRHQRLAMIVCNTGDSDGVMSTVASSTASIRLTKMRTTSGGK
eukprot:UC1_evm3s979